MGLMLPLTRILSFISIAPLFSHNSIPQPYKVGMGVLLTLIVMPTLTDLPTIDILSLSGVLVLAQQIIIGVAIGLMMQIIFSAIELAGQITGMSMGLGFASFYDPQTHANTVATSQLYNLLGLLVFMAMNGHLLLISALMESFQTLPISMNAMNLDGFKIALWGSKVFSVGLHLSLPIIAAMLITNMALGVLTRSAPQLNIFGIGFPITIGVGYITVALVLPLMTQPYIHFIEEGISAAQLHTVTRTNSKLH